MRYLYCDGCGKVHEDKEDFVMCDCGRVAVRMEWATDKQIYESGIITKGEVFHEFEE